MQSGEPNLLCNFWSVWDLVQPQAQGQGNGFRRSPNPEWMLPTMSVHLRKILTEDEEKVV